MRGFFIFAVAFPSDFRFDQPKVVETEVI